MNVIEAIETDFLKSLSEQLCKKTASGIYPVYNELLSNATEQQVAAAGVSLEALIETTRQHEESFLRHATMSLLAARGAPLEQAYSALEQDDSPPWQVQATLGVSKDFVVPHMIDFWFLLRDPDGLEPYLKATRIPGAKKQASALKKIFAKSGKASR